MSKKFAIWMLFQNFCLQSKQVLVEAGDIIFFCYKYDLFVTKMIWAFHRKRSSLKRNCSKWTNGLLWFYLLRSTWKLSFGEMEALAIFLLFFGHLRFSVNCHCVQKGEVCIKWHWSCTYLSSWIWLCQVSRVRNWVIRFCFLRPTNWD